MSARRAIPLAALAAVALVAAGCGGGASSSSGQDATSTPSPTPAPSGGTAKLTLTADPGGQLAFDKPSLRGSAGKVSIALENPAPLSHNIAIDGVGEQGAVVGQGGTSKVTATLNAGTYTYYCAVPGHRQAGMQGTLIVE